MAFAGWIIWAGICGIGIGMLLLRMMPCRDSTKENLQLMFLPLGVVLAVLLLVLGIVTLVDSVQRGESISPADPIIHQPRLPIRL